MNIKTDANTKSLIVAGDQESIMRLFKSADAFVLKMTGVQSIEFEESKIEISNEGNSLGRRESIGKIKKSKAVTY